MGKISTKKLSDTLLKYKEICGVLKLSDEKKYLEDVLKALDGHEVTLVKKGRCVQKKRETAKKKEVAVKKVESIKKDGTVKKSNKKELAGKKIENKNIKFASEVTPKKKRGRGVEKEKLIKLFNGYLGCDESYVEEHKFLILTPKCNVAEVWKKRSLKENLLASKLELLIIYNLLLKKEKVVYIDKRKESIVAEIENYIKNNK